MSLSSSKKGVQLLVSHLNHLEVKHVVISPGSRNAPLIVAFNQHPHFETIVIPDERCAAFHALGMAQQLEKPVVLICTSGSAVLNYYPAVAEALYQNVPLMVISADRPIDWIDQGDGQTIRQENVLKNHVLYYTQLRENHHNDTDSWYNSREIAAAYHACNGKVKGPVHINFPFTEPLYGKEPMDETIAGLLPSVIIDGRQHVPAEEEVVLRSVWKSAEKVMVLVGQHLPNPRLLTALKNLNNLPNVVIMTENTSNMTDRDFVQCIDRTLNGISEEGKSDFAPELLITIGGAIVSKKIKQFFRTYQPKHHWKIGNEFPYMDTYQALTRSLLVEEADFIEALEKYPSETNSNFGAKWKQMDFIQEEKAQEYLFQLETFCDLKVFEFLLDYVPEDSHLHLANSSVIRYSQLFNPVRSLNYWCNRGTSGIDGSISTAAGASWITQEKWHTLIVGDMSFFYDSNAFWSTLKLANFRIFLINNGGGDIFNIIPGPDTTDELKENFVYKHQFKAEGICASYGVRYFKAGSLDEIEQQMEEFYAYDPQQGACVMEIFTNNVENSRELKKFLKI